MATTDTTERVQAAIGVLTSGGDAPGMNAAVRAVVRAAINRGARVFAIREGYQGMVDGGDAIRQMSWRDTAGILQRGGTIIGTARCPAFRERAGRRAAAANLLVHGIDRIVVIGGDGSLTGADIFRREWPSLLAELVADGVITAETVQRHPQLGIVGLVGSIDNDFCGTDSTIGADTALHRIVEAIDAISSTAASHQRTFIIEVMGRNCGYLALAGAIAGGADWVLLPEAPPPDGWEDRMCALLRAGRAAGRRDSIVVVSEGARDRAGQPITSAMVQKILEERLQLEARITILGHVQRGGAPSAYDRWMSSLLGCRAVDVLLDQSPTAEPAVIGIQNNRIVAAPLMQCVADTRAVPQAIAAGDYARAMRMRGADFDELFDVFTAMAQALPDVGPRGRRRLAVMCGGAPAPGMNTAVRAAVRLALEQGHEVLAVRNAFVGLAEGRLDPFHWGSVDGWGPQGGALLGTNRQPPDAAKIAAQLQAHGVDGLLIIGGWSAYDAAHQLWQARAQHAALNIPMLCLPASIDNNLPGSDFSIGADTALNGIVRVVDMIKQSAIASQHRAFVVEVMGHFCGYLAVMAGLASGAEHIYTHEHGIRLADLQRDLVRMMKSFETGNRLSLLIRNEEANRLYSASFMCAMFEEEGGALFDVRQSVLGHMQQGGDPSPEDRVRATQLAARAVGFFTEQFARGGRDAMMIGHQRGAVGFTPLADFPVLGDMQFHRPREQWWLDLLRVAELLEHQKITASRP
jgi:6-phosphofructokinase 1